MKKVVLITGAAAGIGKATAQHFAKLGYDLILADINPDCASVSEELNKAGRQAYFFKCDVAKEQDHVALINYIVNHHGQLDVVFNNAGVEQLPAKITEVNGDSIDRIFNVNIKSIIFGMKHQIPLLKENKNGGAIINTASVAGLRPVEEISVYNASKAAVIMLTKTAALEFAKERIRINAICPGLIMTEMAVRMSVQHPAYFKEKMVDVIPLGRPGQPLEIAELVAWIAEKATFSTGQCFVADGGWSM